MRGDKCEFRNPSVTSEIARDRLFGRDAKSFYRLLRYVLQSNLIADVPYVARGLVSLNLWVCNPYMKISGPYLLAGFLQADLARFEELAGRSAMVSFTLSLPWRSSPDSHMSVPVAASLKHKPCVSTCRLALQLRPVLSWHCPHRAYLAHGEEMRQMLTLVLQSC